MRHQSSVKKSICERDVGTVLASCDFKTFGRLSMEPDSICEARTCDVFKRKLKTHLCEY